MATVVTVRRDGACICTARRAVRTDTHLLVWRAIRIDTSKKISYDLPTYSVKMNFRTLLLTNIDTTNSVISYRHHRPLRADHYGQWCWWCQWWLQSYWYFSRCSTVVYGFMDYSHLWLFVPWTIRTSSSSGILLSTAGQWLPSLGRRQSTTKNSGHCCYTSLKQPSMTGGRRQLTLKNSGHSCKTSSKQPLMGIMSRENSRGGFPLPSSRFLPARRYASAVFATATCLSVCPSHAAIVPSRAKAGSWNVQHLIAPWF